MSGKTPLPFGEPELKHCYVARLLGIRPKELTQMPLRRVLFRDRYFVYDPQQIALLFEQRNPSLFTHQGTHDQPQTNL